MYLFVQTRVETYENVRNFLHSRETITSTLLPNPGDTETSPGACSTLNYAMLDFQNTPSLTSGASGSQGPSYVASHRTYSARRQPCRHRTASSTFECLMRTPTTLPDRRLAQSVDARLNAAMENEEEKEVTEIGSNYVDICPLQTLAINELLRSTL